MTTDSHLINEIGEELFYPKYYGTSYPRRPSEYDLPQLDNPRVAAGSHYAAAYRRFKALIDDGGHRYQRLDQIEKNLTDRAERLVEQSKSVYDEKEYVVNLSADIEKITNIRKLISDTESWTKENKESIEGPASVEPPAIVSMNMEDYPSIDQDKGILVQVLPSRGYLGPYPEDIEYVKKAVWQTMVHKINDLNRLRMKISLADITRDALEDVLFQYETTGSVRTLPDIDIDGTQSGDGEETSPGRSRNLTDEQLESYVRRAEDIKDKPAEEMSHRELARVLKEEVSDDIPYTQSSLRKRLSDFSRD